MAAVDGSSGWQGEKTSEFVFVLNELKSPKNNMVFFFQIWGVVGSEASVEFSTLFLNPSLSKNCSKRIYETLLINNPISYNKS